MAYDGTLLVA